MTGPAHSPEVLFAREKARRTLPVTLLVLLGIIAMYLPLPKRFVAALPLVLALVLAVRLLRFLAQRTGREKVWPTITLGLVGLLLSNLAMQAVYYEAISSYEACVAGAQTQAALAECEKLRQGGPLGGGLLLE